MLNIKLLREEKDSVIESLKVKNFDATEIVEEILSLDISKKKAQQDLDEVLALSNKLAKEIGQLYKTGKRDEAEIKKAESSNLKAKASELKENTSKYNEAFKNNSKIVTPFIKEDRETSWHLYVIKIDNRDKVIDELKQRGVGCSVHFIPIHKHPYYKDRFNYIDSNYPVANSVFSNSLSLPIYPDMSEDEVEYVIQNVLEVVDV
jgi:hypothetical protein